MKTTILTIFALCAVCAPQTTWAAAKATGISDAKYVHCQDKDAEFYMDFGQSKLKKDDLGMTTGTLGVVKVGFRKTGETFQTFDLASPALIANGPSTTIQVYNSEMKLKGWAKTYDFVTGTGELVVPAQGTRKLTCAYYTAPLGVALDGLYELE